MPCLVADDLTPEQIRAYRIADNKTGELSEWDFEKLEIELLELAEIGLQMFDFGFEENTDEDIPDDLDKVEFEKNETVVTIKFENVVDYKFCCEQLKNIAEDNNGIISVKLQ